MSKLSDGARDANRDSDQRAIMRRLEAIEKRQNATVPHGCVCPVGAEATCKGWACPRRATDLSFR
jgi:hypothetical protein